MATLSSMALGQTLMVNRLVDVDWKFGGECLNVTLFSLPYLYK